MSQQSSPLIITKKRKRYTNEENNNNVKELYIIRICENNKIYELSKRELEKYPQSILSLYFLKKQHINNHEKKNIVDDKSIVNNTINIIKENEKEENEEYNIELEIKNRNPMLFENVITYYQKNSLWVPKEYCLSEVEKELNAFGLAIEKKPYLNKINIEYEDIVESLSKESLFQKETIINEWEKKYKKLIEPVMQEIAQNTNRTDIIILVAKNNCYKHKEIFDVLLDQRDLSIHVMGHPRFVEVIKEFFLQRSFGFQMEKKIYHHQPMGLDFEFFLFYVDWKKTIMK